MDFGHKRSNKKNVENLYAEKFINLVIVMFISIICFYIWFSFYPLDVNNDKWLFYGYAESDNIQHYAGWLAYRNSENDAGGGVYRCPFISRRNKDILYG